MIRVKVLHTIKGEYGKRGRGDVLDMRSSVAKNLAMREFVELLTEDDGIDTPPAPVSGGVRIKDNPTGKTLMDSKILRKDTDPGVTGVPRETEKAEADKKEQAETAKKQVEEPKKKEYK
jgi:hypothetical protein